jgi:hypothetical protein
MKGVRRRGISRRNADSRLIAHKLTIRVEHRSMILRSLKIHRPSIASNTGNDVGSTKRRPYTWTADNGRKPKPNDGHWVARRELDRA